ncbi:MAG TPA: HAMP domain-containing sensor histidine kinase [Marmoricola sp.]|nr:HAMP domain-containing sensor histidine kinase [Marmoricola sp.]
MPAHVVAGIALLLAAAVMFRMVVGVPVRRTARSQRGRPPEGPGIHVPAQRTVTLADSAEHEVEYLERLMHGRIPERVAFRVGDLLVDAATARRAAGLEVDVLSHDELVAGVPDDVATVVDQLLDNAQVHGRGRGVVVESSGRGDFVEVVVRDAGPGVPDGLRPQLFRPGARAGADAGNGLGLHIARNLLRAQGGDLELRDGPCGAAFVARIPAQRRGAQHHGAQRHV